jgi:glutathionyl-hydroquinone reductase
MANRDVSGQSDINKMKTSDDGTFKRAAASFRNVIEKGGKFEPAKGLFVV